MILKLEVLFVHTGDRVLVRVVAFDGKQELSNKWEEDVYSVISQPNDSIPVYIVRKENGEGKKRTLHRNLLLPIGSISDDTIETVTQKPSANSFTSYHFAYFSALRI